MSLSRAGIKMAPTKEKYKQKETSRYTASIYCEMID